MRCICCNNILTPQESVRKHKITKEFLDTCNQCLPYIPVPTMEGELFKQGVSREYVNKADLYIDKEDDDDDSDGENPYDDTYMDR